LRSHSQTGDNQEDESLQMRLIDHRSGSSLA
jgi:hypothetical protein